MKHIICLFIISIFIISCNKKSVEVTQKRPNIIFIMADDHAIQAISAYGHPVSKLAPTPNLDRIAKDGAIFKKNYVTNSICGPSRAVILTGKHSHINGFRMNGNVFNGDQPTFPKMFQKAGYQTAIIGKWHLHGYPQGFDHWEILNDQGNYYNPQFIKIKDSILLDKNRIDTTAHWSAKNLPDTLTVEGYATDLITEKAIEFIQKNKDKKEPFMMMVHHKAPHRNWMPAIRHLNKYDAVKFPMPDSYFANHDGSTASQQQLQTIYKDMYEGHDLKMTKEKGSPELAHNPWTTDFERMTPEQRKIWDEAYQQKNDDFHDLNLSGKELAEWKFQRYMQDYLATIAAIDEGVGKILDYLEESGLDENTLIVYTSDQGFYLGEKGFFDKRFMYEESFGMPLLMKYPGVIQPGTEINELTQNLDFAETFLDFAGIDIPEDMQGKSFKPLLSGEVDSGEFRDALYYHYYDFPAFHMVKKMYGIRTDRYKLFHVYDDIDEWELYDLEKDPQELHNLIDDPNYQNIKSDLESKLKDLQSEYQVTEKEFEKASSESIEKSYKNFERLRGHGHH